MTADPRMTSEDIDNEHLYSIQIADKPGASCTSCGLPTGAGPIGFRDGDPVCDRCMLDVCTDLGLVLALVSVTRAFGAIPLKEMGACREGLEQLAAFARVYEHVAVKKAERRGLDLPDR